MATILIFSHPPSISLVCGTLLCGGNDGMERCSPSSTEKTQEVASSASMLSPWRRTFGTSSRVAF